MKIYFLFGKAGAGKTYVGNLMQSHFNAIHFDADKLLTREMKDFIAQGKQFTQEMVNVYMTRIKEKINFFYTNITDNSAVVITQAAYRNINRLDILTAFPQIIFVLIHAESEICLMRIETRNHGVTVPYAKAMEAYFELPYPGFHYITIDNNGVTQETLLEQIRTIIF